MAWIDNIGNRARSIVSIIALITIIWGIITGVMGLVVVTVYRAYEDDIWAYVQERLGLVLVDTLTGESLYLPVLTYEIATSNAARLSAAENLTRVRDFPDPVIDIRSGAAPFRDCIEGEGRNGTGGCPIRATLARTYAGQGCSIIPGATEFFWYDPLTDVTYPAQPNNLSTARNLTQSPRTFDWEVPVPQSLRPPYLLDFCVRPSYTGCPGMVPTDAAHTPEPVCIRDVRIVAPD